MGGFGCAWCKNIDESIVHTFCIEHRITWLVSQAARKSIKYTRHCLEMNTKNNKVVQNINMCPLDPRPQALFQDNVLDKDRGINVLDYVQSQLLYICEYNVNGIYKRVQLLLETVAILIPITSVKFHRGRFDSYHKETDDL